MARHNTAARVSVFARRGHTVCFVGYSINDPVLRYMMDALAVDEMLGEVRPEAYAFGGYEPGQYDETFLEWQAKGVTPLLYEAPGHDHAALHMTLKEWANTYRDRVRGREMIIAQHATTPPLAPTKADFAVGRMLWALTDDLAAKHFADFNPVPPLKWLEPLSEAQFGHGDLTRFKVTPEEKVDDKLAFSFCARPSPYALAPWMSLVSAGAQADRWDAVMFHLARWLLRHVGDPQLLLWVARRGAQLHWQFKRLIEARLNDLSRFEANNDPKLAHIVADGPAAVPSAKIRALWRLMLVGMVKSTLNQRDLWHWGRRFQHEGAIPALRIELRDLLKPCVVLKEPFRLREGDDDSVDRLVDWGLELASDDVTHALKEVRGLNHWPSLLTEMADDFTALLKDALDIKRALGGADDRQDMSYLHHPSISDDPQNRGYHNWTMLIELTRDAWLEVAARNPTRAIRLLELWWDIPYPTFKRLAFFALANPRSPFGISRSLDWLLAEGSWWLWSTEVEREVIRLLVGLAPRLAGADSHRVEEAILVGPPRQMFKEDLGEVTWDDIVDREVWLRLAKLRGAGATLSEAAEKRLAVLKLKHPTWKLAEDQRDEFPFWMGDGDDWKTFSPSPRKRADLLAWLQEAPKPGLRHDDDWRERTSKHFRTAAWALRHLARKGIWPTSRWGQALQAWSQDQTLPGSWKFMGPILAEAPPASTF